MLTFERYLNKYPTYEKIHMYRCSEVSRRALHSRDASCTSDPRELLQGEERAHMQTWTFSKLAQLSQGTALFRSVLSSGCCQNLLEFNQVTALPMTIGRSNAQRDTGILESTLFWCGLWRDS